LNKRGKTRRSRLFDACRRSPAYGMLDGMAVNTEQAADARARCAPSVGIIELPIDDSWLRDSGPAYVVDAAGIFHRHHGNRSSCFMGARA
jgi:hypothetical protein